MVAGIASQEGIERFIEKVNTARENMKAPTQDNPRSRRLRTSPQDHYHIAKSSRVSDDLTAWLAAHGDDPAIEVCLLLLSPDMFIKISLYLFRTSFPDSKTISLPVFMVWSTMVMSTTSLMQIATWFSSPTTKFTNIVFCELTIRHMTYDVNKTLSTPAPVPTLWFSLTKMSAFIPIGMHECWAFSMSMWSTGKTRVHCSRARSAWTSCSCAGSGVTMLLQVGLQSDCNDLNSSIQTALLVMHLDFWTLILSFVGYI